MPKLSEEQKLFIVSQLACFERAPDIRAAVKERYGIDVNLVQIGTYDPNTVSGSRMSEKLKTIYLETREQFRANITDIPIANKAVRLRELQRLADNAAKNPVLRASILEQAAKEVGDAYTNKQKVEAAHSGVVGHVPMAAPAKGSQTADEAYKLMLGGQK